jgi:uncharacterized membrane protein YcaP (DUF421 family)
MAGGYDTVTEGAVLVLTIVGWNWLLDFLSFRFPAVRRFSTPRRLRLIEHGVLLRRNLRREYITVEELQEKLREQGIERFSDVKYAQLEGDGQISVIRKETAEAGETRAARGGAAQGKR